MWNMTSDITGRSRGIDVLYSQLVSLVGGDLLESVLNKETFLISLSGGSFLFGCYIFNSEFLNLVV